MAGFCSRFFVAAILLLPDLHGLAIALRLNNDRFPVKIPRSSDTLGKGSRP